MLATDSNLSKTQEYINQHLQTLLPEDEQLQWLFWLICCAASSINKDSNKIKELLEVRDKNFRGYSTDLFDTIIFQDVELVEENGIKNKTRKKYFPQRNLHRRKLHAFITYSPRFDRKKFDLEYDLAGSPSNSWEKLLANAGVGFEATQAIFCASAASCNSSIKDHIINFISEFKDFQEHWTQGNPSINRIVSRYIDSNAAADENAYESIIKLSLPLSVGGNINYFGTQFLDIFGRESEKHELRGFLLSDLDVAWYQLAGEAGQGKSRLALYLAQFAIELGWEAGFIEEEDCTLLVEHCRDWNPQNPQLLVFDYVVGREIEIREVFNSLRRRKYNSKPIRILLVERHCWNKEGFNRNYTSDHHKSNILEQYKGAESLSPTAWYKVLCSDSKGVRSSSKEIYLDQTRFRNGVLELKPLDDASLFSIVQNIAKHEGINIVDSKKQSILNKLKKIDLQGRALYAYFYGQALVFRDVNSFSHHRELLSFILHRNYEKRWQAVFPEMPVIWADDNSAMRLVVLATITKGLDYKLVSDFRFIGKVNAIERYQAMTLTDTPIKSSKDPGNILLPMLPDILGEWMVLETLNEYIDVGEVMDTAWRYNPNETAAFVKRIVDDFIDHPVTSEILDQTPPTKAGLSSLASISHSILFSHIRFKRNALLPKLFEAISYAAENENNIDAMILYGNWFSSGGFGLEKDDEKAFYWYKKAASYDDVEAIKSMGYFLYKRSGGDKEALNIALSWYVKASEMGDVGVMYSIGDIVSENGGYEDKKTAFFWYKKAAQNNDRSAMLKLSELLTDGCGVRQSRMKAAYWLRKASDLGCSISMNELGNRYLFGNGIRKDKEQALLWYRKAADLGHKGARLNLSQMSTAKKSNAKKVLKNNNEKRILWLQDRANEMHIEAMYQLGRSYLLGEGVGIDEISAFKWIEKAAFFDDVRAMSLLGLCYMNGDGVEKDCEVAFGFFQKSADKWDVDGLLNLGKCFFFGKGTELDYTAAVLWFNRAIEQGSTEAMYTLGVCYEHGYGVEQDIEQATVWFRKAEDAGFKIS